MSTQQPSSRRALLLTVGTGDLARPGESLLAPLRKSIAKGEWSRVVLLPSQVTEQFAAQLKAQVGGDWMEIRPLPAAGQENDADACFSHFNQVIAWLREGGFAATAIVVDFTRGTKAMSAALVLAAIRHDLPTLRYITGERDGRGMVIPGSEHIFETSPAIATAQKTLDLALSLTRRGNFAGALALLPVDDAAAAGWPVELGRLALALRPALDFYAAWDRLDYGSAANLRFGKDAPAADWRPLWPTAATAAWVAELAAPVAAADHPAMAARLRRLACDLLANGERCIRDGHYEDAVLRAYRVLELIGQFRLFDRGFDSACLPADHPAVQQLSAKLAKKGSSAFGVRPDGWLTAAREQVARLLKQLADPLAADLLSIDNDPTIPRISARNHSVLIHGFQAVGPGDDAPLRALYQQLQALLLRDAGDAAQTALRTARQADASIRPGSAL